MNKFVMFFLVCLPFMVGGQVIFESSNLPVISINTLGQPIVDEPKINVQFRVIYNGPGKENRITDPATHYDGRAGIELRGSTSQWFPKKPYGIELRDNAGNDINASLIDMPEESDWILNATYNDKTLMRDGLYYILAGSFMNYAPRVRYNELLINGQYEGIYLLLEKIKRDKNRVDIDKLEAMDSAGDALTGGYILKMDKVNGSNTGDGWNSPYPPFPGAWQKTFFQYEYPDSRDITAVQKNYITGFISQMENAIASPDYRHPETGYRKWIDTQSLMDYIIINELAKNPDAYRLSTFFYKERDSDGGKVHFGPVWDNNLGFGNVDYCTQGNPEGLVITDFNTVCPGDGWVIHFWWKKFLEDEDFYFSLKKRWKQLRAAQLSDDRIHFVIDSISTLLSKAQGRNFQRWPVLGQYVWPNYYVGQTYDEELRWFRSWMDSRLAFLDMTWDVRSDTVLIPDGKGYTVTPNPVSDMLTITSRDRIPDGTLFFVLNMSGQRTVLRGTRTTYQVEADVSGLIPGVYCLFIKEKDKDTPIKFVKL